MGQGQTPVMAVRYGDFSQRMQVQSPLSGVGGIRTLDFKDVATTIKGRNTHLMGLLIQATVPWTTVALSMPGVFPGELFAAAIGDIRLRVGAHEYFRGTMDGLDLMECARQRVDRDFTPPSDLPVADDTGTETITVFIPTSRPQAPGSRRFDYCIAAEALANCSESQMSFTVDGSARGFAGVTFGAATDVQVYAHWVSLDELRETVWHWERFTSSQQYVDVSGGRGGIEAFLWRTLQADGTGDLSDAANIVMQLDGQPIGRAESAAEFAAGNLLMRSGITQILGGTAALDLVSEPTKYSRTKLAEGRLRASWSTRSETERFLGMFTGDRSDSGAMDAYRSALKCPTKAGTILTDAAASGKPTKHDRVLDAALYWKGMPGYIANSKAQKLPIAAIG